MGEVRSAGSFPGGGEEGRVQRLMTNFIVLLEGDQGQHSGMVHVWSCGSVRSGCKEFGPDVTSGSGLALTRAQGCWSSCRSRALGTCRRPLMAAGWWCWGCWSQVPASCVMAPVLPGFGCSSQHSVLVHGAFRGILWAGHRDSGHDAASGSGFAPARAQGWWSGCCPELLESYRRTLMPPGWGCWGQQALSWQWRL